MKKEYLCSFVSTPSCQTGWRCVWAFLLLACTAGMAVAQPRFTVLSDVVNMGELAYMQPKEVVFEFRNTGTEALTVKSVQSSCGCAQVTWPRTPIAAGETGQIKATYDARMLGTFQKELEVVTNAAPEPVFLTLQGRVVATPTADGETFSVDLGTVKLSSNVVTFGDVSRGHHPEVVLQVLNNTRTRYKPQLMHLPPYLTARYQPEQLAGGRVGRIILRLKSDKLKSFGLTQTSIYLARRPGDKVSSENEIDVSAVLLPSFDHLTAEQRATAPRLQLSQDTLDFSTIGRKKKMTQVIRLTNVGQRPLKVSTVQVNGKALTVSLSDRTIQPGRQAKLKVTLTAEHLKAEKQNPSVLLITDDPERPKTVINIGWKAIGR